MDHSATFDEKDTKDKWLPTQGSGYMLQSSSLARNRLNLQHYLWKDSFGYLLHPSIPVSKTAILADVATGTAIWMVELARQYPEMQMDGYDIDTTQASHPYWLPKTISVKHWDAFTEPPPEMVGKYDIVHVRLLVLAMTKEDLPGMATRLVKLLKPGGYLQWDELNPKATSIRRPKPERTGQSPLPTPGLDRLLEASVGDGRLHWTLDIPHVLEQAGGLVDVQIHHIEDRDDMVRIFHEVHMMILEELAVRLMSEGKHEAAKTFTETINLAGQEAQHGAAMSYPRFCCVARKPA